MGGFRAIAEDDTRPGETRSSGELQEFKQSRPGFYPGIELNGKPDGEDILYSYIVSGTAIFELRNRGLIERLPGITTAEIHDKSRPACLSKH